MRVAVASDHAGFLMKEVVVKAVKKLGHEAIDLGTDSLESVDFPDFAEKAGEAVQNGDADRAIVLCGSGVGVCITINKMKGIYAGLISDTYSAHQGVEHDAMNVMCLAGQILGPMLVEELVENFLSAKPMDEEKYKRRQDKFKRIEDKYFK